MTPNKVIDFSGSGSSGGLRFKNIGYSGLCDCLDYITSFQVEYYKPNPSFAVFRKSILDENNFKDMEMMNDSSIFLNSMQKGKMYLFNDPVGFYRVHSANITKGLSPEFIIQNIEEKKKVYNNLKRNNDLVNPEYWWYQQNRLTTRYYINGSRPGIKNFVKMTKWSLKNMKAYKCKYFREMARLEFRVLRHRRK